jgi:hypothetical protein
VTLSKCSLKSTGCQQGDGVHGGPAGGIALAAVETSTRSQPSPLVASVEATAANRENAPSAR